MNPILVNDGSTRPASVGSPSGNINPQDVSGQLRDLENQKLELQHQITELKNNSNLDEELKKKQIEKLEDKAKALEEQIATVKKQQNSAPAQTQVIQENQPLDFSNLPNHQPDEFVKSDAMTHSPTGRYEISQDEQGNLVFEWDKPDEDQNKPDASEIE